MKRAPVRTEAEFQQLMGEVDRQLQAEMVPIPSRPLKAEIILAAQLGEPFVHPVPKREPVDGCYTGHDLTIRVGRWFRARYGDRLKMYFGPGRMVMMVLGDPWLVRLPMLTGTWELILSATRQSSASGFVSRLGQPSVPLYYNIVDSFVDLPRHLVDSLTEDQVREIITKWRGGFEGLNALRAAYGRHELVGVAMADWDTAVDQLSNHRGDRGLARWASLQVVEKMLKAYIALRDSTYKWSHDLGKLADDAESLGLTPIDRRLVTTVQCSPGVRYGTEQVTLESAVAAHHAALRIASQVATAIAGLPKARPRS